MTLTHEQVEALAGRDLDSSVKACVSHWKVEKYGGAVVLEPYEGEELTPLPGIEVNLSVNNQAGAPERKV